VSKQRGLPTNRRMRHDQHFVDNLTSGPAESIGRLIPIDQLIPNPDQPRKMFGDIADLVSSIKEKGVLEPVLVRPAGEKFQIIAGERRYRASLQAGLSQVPCIELDVDDRGVLEISLIENLQRLDLDPFEEADGLQKLSEKFLYTHEEIARKLGKSRTSITETLSLNNIPIELRGICREAGIATRSTLLEVARLGTPEAMAAMIHEIRRSGLTRDDVRRMKDKEKQQAGRPRGFLFRFKPSDSKFFLNIRFRRSEVSKDEIIQTLQDLIEQLQKS